MPDDLPTDENRLRFRNGPSLRDYLELMRIPNVFTAMADVTMGFLFVQSTDWRWSVWDSWTLAALAAASCLLYMAGMVLNDVFDADLDSRQRPERPIPSGRVPLDSARRLGWRLLIAGVATGTAAAFFTGHLRPGVAAAVLAIAIVLYDAWLKRTPLGPVAMGACRTLNVLLGISAADVPLRAEHWLVAGAVGVYVAGVTWFARTESERSRRGPLLFGVFVMLLGIATLAWFPYWSHRALPELWDTFVGIPRWWLLIISVAVFSVPRCLNAVADPTPGRVRIAVSQAILWIIILDAVACYAVRGIFWAGLILLFLVPATFLRNRLEMT
jgi:4-hydroxybenzoate polyprenyltransferase